MLCDIPVQREAHLVIQKTAKAIDQPVVQASRQSLQLIDNQLLQRRRGLPRGQSAIYSNKAFASIVEIREAQERATERQEALNRVDRDQDGVFNHQCLIALRSGILRSLLKFPPT